MSRMSLDKAVRRQRLNLRKQEERIYQISDIIESPASAARKVQLIADLLDTFSDIFVLEVEGQAHE